MWQAMADPIDVSATSHPPPPPAATSSRRLSLSPFPSMYLSVSLSLSLARSFSTPTLSSATRPSTSASSVPSPSQLASSRSRQQRLPPGRRVSSHLCALPSLNPPLSLSLQHTELNPGAATPLESVYNGDALLPLSPLYFTFGPTASRRRRRQRRLREREREKGRQTWTATTSISQRTRAASDFSAREARTNRPSFSYLNPPPSFRCPTPRPFFSFFHDACRLYFAAFFSRRRTRARVRPFVFVASGSAKEEDYETRPGTYTRRGGENPRRACTRYNIRYRRGICFRSAAIEKIRRAARNNPRRLRSAGENVRFFVASRISAHRPPASSRVSDTRDTQGRARAIGLSR